MANEIKLKAGTNTQIITNAEPANTALAVSDEVDNATSLNTYADFELQATFGSAPVAGGYVTLYLVPAQDGTNYADAADGSVIPSATLAVGRFPLRAVTTAQRVAVRNVPLPPSKFKCVIENKAGQDVSANTGQLFIKPFNFEVQ